MRIVVQRVLSASLSVGGKTVSETGRGLVVYFGVGKGDTEADCDAVVRKIANLRVFEDGSGKMNLSALTEKLDVLFVSQFTLYGDCRKGNRPSFTEAELPERANELYEGAAEKLRALGLNVKTGVFGADMRIEQICDGPVTVIYDTKS